MGQLGRILATSVATRGAGVLDAWSGVQQRHKMALASKAADESYERVNNAYNNGYRKATSELVPEVNSAIALGNFHFTNFLAWKRTAEVLNSMLPQGRQFGKETLRQMARLNRLLAIRDMIEGRVESSKPDANGEYPLRPKFDPFDGWVKGDPSYMAQIAQEADASQKALAAQGIIDANFDWRKKYGPLASRLEGQSSAQAGQSSKS